MKIRFTQSVKVTFDAQPGDVLIVKRATPELDALLHGGRLNGERLAEVVEDKGADETAVLGAAGETATTGGGRRGARAANLPG